MRGRNKNKKIGELKTIDFTGPVQINLFDGSSRDLAELNQRCFFLHVAIFLLTIWFILFGIIEKSKRKIE